MKKIIIISLILLLLSVSAISANDDLNQTDIQVPEKIWKDGNNSISIETDEASEIEISGAITYNSTLNPGKTSIPINLTTGRHSIYINSQNTQKEYNITVLKENPHWNLDFDFLDSDEILYTDPYDNELISNALVIRNMPEGLTGNFTFYVNEEMQLQWNSQDYNENGINYGEYYDEKVYNFTLKYSGDDYFYPVSKSKIVEFVPILITVPKEIVLGYDDTIYITSAYDTAKGNVTIKINNKTVLKKDRISLIYAVEYSLNKLEANKQYDIEVNFSSDFYNKTKKLTVNVTDHIKDYVTFLGKDTTSQDNFKYAYASEPEFYILAPKLNLNIAIDSKKVEYFYDDGLYEVDVSDLAPGKHEISVSYTGNKKYAKNTFRCEFEIVSRAEYSSEVVQNELNNFLLYLPDDAVGNVTIDLKRPEDREFKFYRTIGLEESTEDLELPTDHIGTYLFKAYFNGNYEINEISGKYFVKDYATWNCKDDWAYINDSRILTLELPDDGRGNLTVEIKRYDEIRQNYTVEVENGRCDIPLPTDHIGKYSIKTSFAGNYELFEYKNTYDVYSKYYISDTNQYLSYNCDEFISIELPKDGVGTLTLEIKYNKNDTYAVYKSVELEKGKASIKLPTNYVGTIFYNALYSGNYELYNTTDYEILINPSYSFKNSIFKLIGPDNLNGSFYITDWEDYNVKVNVINGTASIHVADYLKQIDEEEGISLFFTSADGVKYEVGYEFVKPIYNVRIVAKDLSMYYGDSKTFKAKIYRNNKPVGKNKIVTIKIGNKKYYVKTDKNGIASLKITQIPKKYTITVIYKNKSLKKRLTVKQVLTLKTAKVKKSARKLILQATLKKGKKPITGKIIKFKFGKKIYKAKTNRYGIAKVTIKKAVLKKLKAGKKLTYTATYLKNTVKKTVKVKR